MSIATTRRFFDRNAALRDHAERFVLDAHRVVRLDVPERIELIEETVTFLAEILLPRAYAEERVLFREAGRVLGDPDLGFPMSRERAEVRRLLRELAAADPRDAGQLQEILYALHTLLSAHFWRTEEVYLRLLDEEPDDEMRALIDRVDAHERGAEVPAAS